MKPTPHSPELAQAISVQRMRDSDAYTIAHLIPSKELMYRAAMGVFESVDWQGKTPVILCGSGNNGGDGYALAGILADHGIPSKILRVSERFSEDGAYYYNIALSKGVKSEYFAENSNLSDANIIVDCILGTGFYGFPREIIAAAIQKINESKAYVVSVDINSGMNGDTGEAELAVRSDLTVSIGYYKTGHFIGKAPELIGELVNIDIGIVLI
ncbi:MAG: NAD(P)H-hydrate epimerase [Oscillospiraceae bacterium]|nr:NAD(P)H-hydrate epimerase [Oscillospiraceae bacterium]